MKRRCALAALLLCPMAVLPRRLQAGVSGPRYVPGDPQHDRWFANQSNEGGGSCCKLGDGFALGHGDLRYDDKTGLYSVRLPDPNDAKAPKVWVEVADWKLRDPSGGRPPIADPVVWYSIRDGDGPKYYEIWCLEPNPQL